MKKLIILFSAVLFLVSCGKKVTNEGTIVLENGKKEKVEIPFTCVGCAENIAAAEEFDKLVGDITALVKEQMNYPLSFIPVSLSMTVQPRDSIISFTTNQLIPNLLSVSYAMGYIAQNAYGAEKEGNIEDILYLSNGKKVDLYKEMKLADLVLEEESGSYWASRALSAFSGEDNSITVRAFYSGKLYLHIKTSLSCIDEGNRFYINLEKEEQPIILENMMKFNCDGEALVEVTDEQKEVLLSDKVLLLSFYTKKDKVSTQVPVNAADYFQQVVRLDPAKVSK